MQKDKYQSRYLVPNFSVEGSLDVPVENGEIICT